MKPSDEIQPEIKPKPEQFDNNTPRTKEEWFKSKWKTEKNFKRSNALKRRIPRYISIKYRSTLNILYLHICYVAIGEHWRKLFCDTVNICENCIFIFFLNFNFF